MFPHGARRSLRRDARGAIGAAQAWGAAGLVVALTVGGAVVANADLFEGRLHRTTQDSVDGLSLGLGFGGVLGFVGAGPAGPVVQKVHIDVRVVDGAETVDLRHVVVRMTNGHELAALTYGNATPDAARFTAKASLDADRGVLNGTLGRADVAVLVLDLEAAGMALGPRETLTLRFQAAGGPAMEVDVHAPSSFASDRIVDLERDVRRGR